MNKRKFHHIWVKIKPVSYWYFFIAFIICAFISVIALRDNNLTAISLRNKLNTVDQQNGDVATALNNLRSYVYSHMNTNLASGSNAIYPPVQLQYTYQRLVAAKQASQKSDNTQIYTEAENYCQNLIPNGFSGRYRINCIETYVTSHSSVKDTIPPALYEFDFISPFWSPDLAGWSIIASIIFVMLFIVRFILEKWLNYNLKKHL